MNDRVEIYWGWDEMLNCRERRGVSTQIKIAVFVIPSSNYYRRIVIWSYLCRVICSKWKCFFKYESLLSIIFRECKPNENTRPVFHSIVDQRAILQILHDVVIQAVSQAASRRCCDAANLMPLPVPMPYAQ